MQFQLPASGRYVEIDESGDTRAVAQALTDAYAYDTEISDGAARTIATWFHSPANGDAALRFIATGAITGGDDAVIRGLYSSAEYDAMTPFDQECVSFLGTYLLNREERGAVANWSRLWVR